MPNFVSRPRADPLRMYRILRHFWVFYIFALVAFGLAAIVHEARSAFLSRASIAEGSVVGLGLESGRRSAAASPIFTFTDSAGKEWTIHSQSGGPAPGYSVGQRVQVVYMPASPAGAELLGESGSGSLVAFLLVTGVVHTLVATAGTWAWRARFSHLTAFRG